MTSLLLPPVTRILGKQPHKKVLGSVKCKSMTLNQMENIGHQEHQRLRMKGNMIHVTFNSLYHLSMAFTFSNVDLPEAPHSEQGDFEIQDHDLGGQVVGPFVEERQQLVQGEGDGDRNQLPPEPGGSDSGSEPEGDLHSEQATDPDEPEDDPDDDPFNADLPVVRDLGREWEMIKLGRNCSDAVSSDYWHFAFSHCEDILRIKQDLDGNIPNLNNIRRNIMTELPPIKMDFIFRRRNRPEDEQYIFVRDQDTFPKKAYPSKDFQLIAQITMVQPAHIIKLHRDTGHRQCPTITTSVDGVNETNSSARSLEVVSMMFDNCDTVYPLLMMRPEEGMKKNLKGLFLRYVTRLNRQIVRAGLRIRKTILDAPERAFLRGQTQHGGYFSCDICLANPISIDLPGNRGKKRVFTQEMLHVERRTHEQTLEWAEEAERTGDSVYGIKAPSPFQEVPGFDLVRDMLPEALHWLDGGFTKNTMLRTFRGGGRPQTRENYRQTNSEELSRHLAKQTVPSDFPRLARLYVPSVYKALEWRNIILFHFPIVLHCLEEEKQNEILVFLSYAFLSRAVRLPEEEYQMVPPDMLQLAIDILVPNYTEAYGVTAGTYNSHHVFAHLLEIREELGPLTQHTSYPFEGTYAELRRSFQAGTPNVSKQIFQKMLLRKFRPGHPCRKAMKPVKPYDKKFKARDDLIYTFANGTACLFQVVSDGHDGEYTCHKFNVEPKTFHWERRLDFGLVGVFQKQGLAHERHTVQHRDIKGKVISSKGLLITVPLNILLEY